MGFAAFSRIPPAKAADLLDLWTNPPAGVVWIVGRIIDRPGRPPEIQIQGASLDEIRAEAMVVDGTYFVAPLPLDILLPEKPLEWYGLRFPLRDN